MTITPVLNLQDIVDSYEDPAVLISDQFEIIKTNSAYLELYALDTHTHGTAIAEYNTAAAEALKQRKKKYCYEVSHHYSRSCEQEGESCPLQLARSTQTNQRVLHVHHTRYGEEHVDVSLYPIRDMDDKIYFLEVMKTIKHASPKSVQQGMVGKSPAFNHLLGLINRVADYDISVLLQGDSGSGKELVARAIHQASQRHSQSCVTVECSGLSEALFESELFGHEKGAFTGAVNKKKGLVEQAEGGTLFLDEIGDVPMSLQVKLLRLIETGTFRRVGGVEQLNTDFRLICASHKDLQMMVRQGSFREDLYYRISTFPVKLPSLNERSEDIPLLIDTLLERICGHKKMRLSETALNFLQHYEFPGNIRQLRNILEYGRVMTDSFIIEMEHLPEELFNTEQRESDYVQNDYQYEGSDSATPAELMSLEEHENNYLRWLKLHYQDDKAALARQLGISERTLYRKLQDL